MVLGDRTGDYLFKMTFASSFFWPCFTSSKELFESEAEIEVCTKYVEKMVSDCCILAKVFCLEQLMFLIASERFKNK